jgi:hypothetical protein
MTRFVTFPSDGARELTAADLDAAFDSVDAVKGILRSVAGNASTSSWARSVPGYGLRDDTTTVVSVSPGGFTAFQAYTRTSDTGSGNAGGMAAFGYGGYAENDNTVAVQTAYVMYLEGRRQAGTGTIHGQENNIVNFGTTVQINPYFIGADGSSLNYWASAGRTDQGAQQNLTCIFGAVNNGAQWTKGFVFGANSIASGPIGSEFMTVAPGYAIGWSNPANNDTKAFIRSDATSSTTAGRIGMIFTDAGLVVQTPDSIASLAVSNGSVQTTNLQVVGNVHGTGSLVLDGPLTVHGFESITGDVILTGLHDAVDEGAAAAAGVPSHGVYRNGTVLQVRIT